MFISILGLFIIFGKIVFSKYEFFRDLKGVEKERWAYSYLVFFL